MGVSTETCAAQICSCASGTAARKVATPVGSTFQAHHFMNAWKKIIGYKLEGAAPPNFMQNIDKLINAAEQLEANLEISAKVGWKLIISINQLIGVLHHISAL